MIFQKSDTPVMCKELWDRQGANIASRQKEMYGEKSEKEDFGERSTLFRRSFIANGLGNVDIRKM